MFATVASCASRCDSEVRLERDVLLLPVGHAALRVQHFELNVRVAELEENRRWLDRYAGSDRQRLDSA